MTTFALDPLTDPRWGELVERDARTSIFHTPGWLGALNQTYGYDPIAFTTSPPDRPLRDALVFCEIRSWLTGTRLVSLPFSDHCDPLGDNGEADGIWRHLETQRGERGWQYVEVRPRRMTEPPSSGFDASEEFWLHEIDLPSSSGRLFESFHRSVQRKIRRAERERLAYDEGRGEDHLVRFHRLLALTRRRHGLPLQPLAWFRNLAASLGPALKIRIARCAGVPVAAILTLRHHDAMVYKYGASDAAFHPMGGMHLLLWTAMCEAQADGCAVFDLGRTDVHQTGLVTFKDRWGANRTRIVYFRSPGARPEAVPALSKVSVHARRAFGRAPRVVSSAAGRLLYRHMG